MGAIISGMRADLRGLSGVACAVAVIAVAAIYQVGLSAASAQSPCEQLVVDEAGVFGASIGRVEDAASELVKSGADVRIRAIRSFGAAGNLDQFEKQVEAQCPSWRSPEGGRKNNLIVLMLSLDERKTGLYYGDQWEKALGAHWIRIQTDLMNPRFRDGDFAGGFIDGLREVRRLVEEQTRPSLRTPSGLASQWSTLRWLLLAAVVMAAGFFLYTLVVTSRREREKRRAAQQKARLAKQGAASRINDLLEKVQLLEIKINAMATMVSTEDTQPLAEDLGGVRQLVGSAAQQYGDLAHSAGDPERPDLSVAEYAATEEAYQKVLVTLREADGATNGIEQRLRFLEQAPSEIPVRLSEAGEAIKGSQHEMAAMRLQGFKTAHLEQSLGKARAALETAIQRHEKMQLGEALKCAEEAKGMASQALASARELPRQKQEAEGAIGALASRIGQTRATIAATRPVFEEISATYNESSWEPIRGNGTEATNRLDWSVQALEAARDSSTMQRQEWQTALELVGESNGWLDQADSLMRSVRALQASLAVARRDAPAEIAAAEADIARAWGYINTYDEDIRESLEDDLRGAQQLLDEAKIELAKDKPDYLRVVMLAKETNATADKILEQARSEHEAAERLRAKATSELRDARAAVSKAKEYIEDHHVEVGSTAKTHLADAQAHLRDAEATSDLAERVSLFERAESEAERAYSKARNDVAEVERARRPLFPIGGGWGSPSPRPPRRGSTGGGGGPISWGSGSRGGGSTSWGSGRGGGGSRGW